MARTQMEVYWEVGSSKREVTEAVQQQCRLQCYVWQQKKWRSYYEAHKTLQFAPQMAAQHLQQTGASQQVPQE